ncbi:MAG: hypothetical protein Q9167_000083 [Letrouitia subvulpina]
MANTSAPPTFLTEGGIGDAIHILRDYHKQSISEGNKAKTIEEDVVLQLTGLRSDLQQKIKEIKNLSGDFKNNVDRETEGTRKAVRDLQEALGVSDTDPNAPHGRGDPYIVKLGAFLNLESSGRELESIVVGEIQKAYNAYSGIIKREADEAYDAVERLRTGPVAIPKDHEWDAFVENNKHFVNPKLPVRRFQNISYPGRDHPAASEVKAGMLERKSKYLKSYTAGWYVLSPTHLHEFKSPDRITSQAPVMSLNLAEQKLGSHSGAESSSHKFMLKGRQSGGMHRGHAWVFRAESHDTMLAWYEDLKSLTEKTGEERKAFIRRHARSVSGGSQKAGSISSEGALDEDEADQVPYSAAASQIDQSQNQEKLPERPNPGGRFPSALNINRDSQVPLSPSSPSSSGDRDAVAAAGALPGSGVPFGDSGRVVKAGDDEVNAFGETKASPVAVHQSEQYNNSNLEHQVQSGSAERYPISQASVTAEPGSSISRTQQKQDALPPIERHDSTYGDWMGPAASGAVFGVTDSQGNDNFNQRKGDGKQRYPEGLQLAGNTSVASDENEVREVRMKNSNAGNSFGKLSTQRNEPNPNQTASSMATVAQESSPGVSKEVSHVPLPSQQAPQLLQDEHFPVLQKEDNIGLSMDKGLSTSSTIGIAATGEKDPSAPEKVFASEPRSKTSTRPGLESHQSAATISDLHIPGEYPPTPAVGGQHA